MPVDRTKMRRLGDGHRTTYQDPEDDAKPKESYEEYMYRTKKWSRPHPLKKVPGCGNAVWDPRIGRWVVYRSW